MFEPQDIHPQLTDERIDTVGQLIMEAHEDVIERAEPYDNGWSLGCRSHTWRSSRIAEAAMADDYPWLRLVDGSLRFVFSIEGIEVSMYRGSSESPKENILSRAVRYPELQQMTFLDEFEDDNPELVWSYAMETGPEGEVVNLQFVGTTSDGAVIAQRTVPIDTLQAPLTSLNTEDYKPVEVPPASVGLKTGVTSEKDSDEDQDTNEDENNSYVDNNNE